MRDSLVLRLGRAEFETIAAKCPGIWRTLTALAVAAARRHDSIRAGGRPIRGRAPSRSFAPAPRRSPSGSSTSWHRVFSASANTLVLDAARAAGVLPAACTSTAPRRRRRSTSSRARYDYLLFLADAELTPWSQKAIRHADLVLVVATHDADPAPNRARAARRGIRQPGGAPPRRRARRAARRSRVPPAGCAAAASPCTITWRSTTAARWRGSTASSTAPRSASSPAAAARSARPTSAFTRR